MTDKQQVYLSRTAAGQPGLFTSGVLVMPLDSSDSEEARRLAQRWGLEFMDDREQIIKRHPPSNPTSTFSNGTGLYECLHCACTDMSSEDLDHHSIFPGNHEEPADYEPRCPECGSLNIKEIDDDD